jgi:hypothetical protein
MVYEPVLLFSTSFFIRASIKAAIVLQPLLGITNFLQIVNSPYGVGTVIDIS